MNKRDFITHGAAVLIGALIVVISSMTDEDLQRDRDLYCEMVQLYDSTDGEYGWPDYRNDKASCV
jgi:hypothetical protein